MIFEDYLIGAVTLLGVIALGVGMDWLSKIKDRRRNG